MYKKYQCVLRAMGSLQAADLHSNDLHSNDLHSNEAVEVTLPVPVLDPDQPPPSCASRMVSHSQKSGVDDGDRAARPGVSLPPTGTGGSAPPPGTAPAVSAGGKAQDDFVTLCGGNRYTTTLHCLNSAIVKLSKIQRAVKVYRGMSRAALPATFWHPSEANCRGAVEVRRCSSPPRPASTLSHLSLSNPHPIPA
eukprot:scaffold14402_cov79-Isochrysis_galbana.AAC.1